MNPTRRRRLLLVLALAIAAGVATTLITFALQHNVAYLYTPSEVLNGEAGGHARFRLGGMVERGSLSRTEDSLDAYFRITDGDNQLSVRYTGILPDLFREGQAVIATGAMQGAQFIATEVLAKHDETYMPREVAEKMGQAHQKHDIPVPPTPAEQR